MEDNKKAHRFKFILKLVIVISIILKFIMYKMNDRGEYIFIFSRGFPHFILSFLIIIGAFFCIMIADKKKWIRVITTIALIIAIPSYMFMSLLLGGGTYFQFESPNGNNTLVIEEDGFLMGGWFYFYRKDGIKIKRIGGRAIIDDGYAPLSNGDYELQWIDEDTVRFQYKFNENWDETVTIKFHKRE